MEATVLQKGDYALIVWEDKTFSVYEIEGHHNIRGYPEVVCEGACFLSHDYFDTYITIPTLNKKLGIFIIRRE